MDTLILLVPFFWGLHGGGWYPHVQGYQQSSSSASHDRPDPTLKDKTDFLPTNHARLTLQSLALVRDRQRRGGGCAELIWATFLADKMVMAFCFW